MRALCAAIITAGSLVGLGLTAIGFGTRYQSLGVITNDYIHWKQLDTPLMLIIVVLVATLLAGIGATFLGLAYHHERRCYEREHLREGSKSRTILPD